MKTLRLLLLGAAFALTSLQIDAAEDKAPTVGFIDCFYKDSDAKEHRYVIFVPHSYKGEKEYPIVMFLHGSGETGTDGVKQTKVGLGPAIRKKEKEFPAIVVFPQSEKRTWKADSEDGKRAIAILDEVQKKYKADPKRVYLTGLSMGGYGTWSMAVAYPDRWAAIVPVCGGGDPKEVEKIKQLPIWCFHGDKDVAVPVTKSVEMIEALKKIGAKPKYTEYLGVGHNCWDKAYGTDELYTWLWEQRRK